MAAFLAILIVFLIPAIGGSLLIGLHKLANRSRMFIFHYVEYSYDGKPYTTRENGALNDLAGVGLLKEIKERGGVVKLHRTGTEPEIEQYIDYRYYQTKPESKP